jgi:hypothetical protein
MMKRATTPEQKHEIIERLLNVWLSVPELRLGQLIDNGIPFRADGESDIFYIEDYELIECVEDLYK